VRVTYSDGAGGVSFLGGAATGGFVEVSALGFGRLSGAPGSVRFFGFGFSAGDRGAGREANRALCRALMAFSRRLRLRLSSRSFSRTSASTMNSKPSVGAL